jgi:hypothetical protein
VAGDDTVLCVASEQVGGRRLAAQLGQLAGIAKKDDSSGTKSDMKSGTKSGTKPGAQTAKKKVSSRG